MTLSIWRVRHRLVRQCLSFECPFCKRHTETRVTLPARPAVRRSGVALTRRRKGQPACVIAIADKAQQRLCRRFRKLTAQHKPAAKIVVAIARELAGSMWAALQPAPATVN